MADGYSRSSQAAIGSSVAVAATREALEAATRPAAAATSDSLIKHIWSIFESATNAYISAVTLHASQMLLEPSDFKTTLSLALICDGWIVLAAVGDAFAVAGTENGKVYLVMPPEKLGVDSNQTRLLAAGAKPRCFAIFDEQITGLVLSTDGLENFLTDEVIDIGNELDTLTWAPSPDTFGPMLGEVRNGLSGESLAEILARDEFRKSKGDDIGVAVATY